MTSWKDVCREKNGSDVCDTEDACQSCITRAKHLTNPPVAMPISGTPRDLPTIEAHMERMEAWSIKLWEHKEMKLLHCKNVYDFDDATPMLENIRNDVGAALSAIRALKRELDRANS